MPEIETIEVVEQLNNVADATAAKKSDGVSNYIRPVTMEEVVGLEHIKKTVYYDFTGAKKLGEPYPHLILSGSGGLGKSTVAGIVAGLTGGQVHKYLASDWRKADDVYDAATMVNDNDVVILEEAAGMAKIVALNLLTWLDEYKLYGGGAAGVVDAPKVCFVFPTTNAGKLSQPLRSRCRILQLNYYSRNEMEEILCRAAKKYGMNLRENPDALKLLAQSSRGTPRIGVLHRLDMLRKVMSVDSLPFDISTVEYMFKMHHINQWGLEHNDLVYCNTLYEKMKQNEGRPVSRKIMMQATGFAEDVVEGMIEAYLQQINIINVSSQGRFLTPFGYEVLERAPIHVEVLDQVKQKSIDKAKLRKVLEDHELCAGGMKMVAPMMGLRYPQDNAALQAALWDVGYIAKQRIGIVKIES